MDFYRRRLVDDQLDLLFPELAAISLDGPKGVGKTATATQRAKTTLRLDSARDSTLVRADPELIERAAKPLLLDEWQRVPEVWDAVRRGVDADDRGAQYLLTGSAAPVGVALHSGAGRIVSMRMRPLSLAERDIETPTVSLRRLFEGGLEMSGDTGVALEQYVHEIVASGFPAIRQLSPRARHERLQSYITQVIEREFAEQGRPVRRPATLRGWMAAYAAATASTANYSTILDAATPGEANKPSRPTTTSYRDVLSQLWLLDPVPAWFPSGREFARLAATPKHFLADPALAAVLLGFAGDVLDQPPADIVLGPQQETLLGRLFESLIALSLFTYAQVADATVSHLRTRNGDHEIDFLVHRPGGAVVALEVKLAASVSDSDVRHLLWLKQQLGEKLRDMVVIYTGPYAYRRRDGVAVVPASLLGA